MLSDSIRTGTPAVAVQRSVRPPKCKIDAVWYRVEFLDDDGKWKDAGDAYEDDTKQGCRLGIVCVNFWPHKVRMVQHFHAYFPIGKIKDMGKDCYKPRKRSNVALCEVADKARPN